MLAAPGRIVEWLRGGFVRAGVDDRIAAEYGEVLCRPELGLPPHEVRLVLRRILSLAIWDTSGRSICGRDCRIRTMRRSRSARTP